MLAHTLLLWRVSVYLARLLVRRMLEPVVRSGAGWTGLPVPVACK